MALNTSSTKASNQTLNLPAKHTYLCLHIVGAVAELDELSFRRAIQDALSQLFGISAAGLYLDVLCFQQRQRRRDSPPQPQAAEELYYVAVIRVAYDDAASLKAAFAIAKVPGATRLSLMDESNFLPALLASTFVE